MKKIICCILSVTVVALLFSGCGGKQKFTDYSFDYFDTVTTIVGYAKNQREFDENCDQIKAELEEYHKLYDIYTAYQDVNNLYTVNQTVNGKHKTVTVDKKIIDLLLFSKQMYDLTDGKVNIAMGSVLKIWHNYREEGKAVPPTDILQKANEHTDINNIIIDETASTVYIADSEMTVDVGAVAKGYAAEQVAKWMTDKGYLGYILNLGGNVRIVGKQQNGEGWKIGIENPDTENQEKPYIEYLTLNGYSLVTSGSYQRYYTVNGKNYHHIIDPETLMPSEYFKSVSVLCENSAVADALSTALFCMSYEDGLALVETCENTEAMWVNTDGQQLYSSGFKDYCTEQ